MRVKAESVRHFSHSLTILITSINKSIKRGKVSNKKDVASFCLSILISLFLVPSAEIDHSRIGFFFKVTRTHKSEYFWICLFPLVF